MNIQLPDTDFPSKNTDTNDIDLLSEFGNQDYIVLDGPPYANGNLHIGHALNKILKDIFLRWNNGYMRPGWDCHGLPIERAVGENKSFQEYADFADHWLDIQKEQFQKFGVKADWSNHYETKSNEMVSHISKCADLLINEGVVRQKFQPVWWSPSEKTVLAESEVEYKDVKHLTGTFLFRHPSHQTGIAVWTTLPWTLCVCEAVAFNRNLEYVITEDDVIYQKDLVPENKTVLRPFDIEEGIELKHPFLDKTVKLYHSDHVTGEMGTGFVQIAPAHENEQYVEDLPFNDFFASEHGDMDNETIEVIKKSAHNGTLLSKSKITHSFPCSWRSKEPVYLRWLEQWFFEISDQLKNRCFELLDQVYFPNPKDKEKLVSMIESRDDWCISRQRTWGVKIDDKDILDVWFDSGCVFMNHSGGVADLVIEGKDQFRGWFQSLTLLSVALTDSLPFKTLVSHGFVLDEKGQKMSKSDGNVVCHLEMIEQYGVDTLRYWVASSNYKSDINVSKEIMKQSDRSVRKIRNTFKFLLGNIDPSHMGNRPTTFTDDWMLERLENLDKEITECYAEYNVTNVVTLLETFINRELSAFYFDVSKDTLYCDALDSEKRMSCVFTLNEILSHLKKWLFPITPFLVEEVTSYE